MTVDCTASKAVMDSPSVFEKSAVPETSPRLAQPREPSQEVDPNLLMLEVVFSSTFPHTPSGYARKLRAVEEAKGPLFDEEQFVEWRRALLLDLAEPGRDWAKSRLTTLAALGVSCGAAYAGYALGIAPMMWVGLAVALSIGLTVAILGRSLLQARRLTLMERLAIVDSLLSESRISSEEADELRSRATWHHGR